MLEVNGHEVLNVEQIQTASQIATVKTFHDMLYHTELAHSAGTVTATVKNYLGEVQTGYSTPITFDLNGTQTTATPTNGVASITVTLQAGGTYTVKTVNQGIRNGEVVINA